MREIRGVGGGNRLPESSCGHHVARSRRICPTVRLDGIHRRERWVIGSVLQAQWKKGRPWSCVISTPCSPSPRRGRSRLRRTRWPPCSRTCPIRCASSRRSWACRCSSAAGAAPSPRSSACSCSSVPDACSVSSRTCAPTSRCCRDSSPGTRASAWSAPRAAGSCPRSSPTSASGRPASASGSTRARRSGSSPSWSTASWRRRSSPSR